MELLRRVTDIYLASPDENGEVERYLLNSILNRIVVQVERHDKPALATSLARLPALPDDVARPLATDRDMAIAGPILRGCVGLSDAVLVDAARHGSQEHLKVIAERSSVAVPVSDVLVRRGNRAVAHSLAANAGARFSDSGMHRLVERSQGDPGLQKLLAERSDVSDAALERLMPLIIKGLAARRRDAAGGIDKEAVRAYLIRWLRERRIDLMEVETCIDLVRNGQFALADAAWQFLSADRLLDAANVLAASVNLDHDQASSILTLGKVSSALLLLRSLELDWPTVAAFLALRDAKFKRGDYDSSIHEREFLAIDMATAQRVVRFMKVRRAAKAA